MVIFLFSIDHSGHRVVYVKRGSDNSVLINKLMIDLLIIQIIVTMI